ncbi:MAG: sugar transporter [Bacteroidaceae bacterium]|nr:sugar transporter [Bacteroidaceae bacterium]
MANASRIAKSVANARVNVLFYIITLVLAFFSRKVFLNNLGTEFLGLSSALGDILSLMNITELGIGTAVAVTLYKPLFDDNRTAITDIISVYGFLYTIIGALIASASVIVSCFFPLMFADTSLPLWLVYFLFFALVYGALLSYFVNYPQIVLSASQNNYVIIYRYQTITVIKVLLQMACSHLPHCYVWWVLIEVLAGTVNSIVLRHSVRKHYPWLATSIRLGRERFHDYKDLWIKTKQVFVLKLSHLVFNGSINLFIGMFVSLPMVALYGNYNMVMSKLTSFVDGLFTGMEASVGNLIAEGNRAKTLGVFFELLSIRYFLAGLLSIVLYFTTPALIVVWLGEEYVLSELVLVLISLHIFFQQGRLTVDNFKNGFGLYSDVWAPVAEVVICVVLCVVLGRLFGLAGILAGFVTAEFLIKMFWKPYFLFSRGFEVSVLRHYWPVWLRFIVIILACAALTLFASRLLRQTFDCTTWLGFIAYAAAIGAVVLMLLTTAFWLCDRHFRTFLRHINSYITR